MKVMSRVISSGGGRGEYRYPDALIPAFALLLRLAMGWVFIWAGFHKLITGWSAQGFLLHATSGPLKDVFERMGGSQVAMDVVNPLVIYGEILIGVALILGIFTRFALLMGAIMMLLFYVAQLWPANNPFMEYYLIYMGLMALLGALGAGRIFGLDGLIEKWRLVRRFRRIEYVLG